MKKFVLTITDELFEVLDTLQIRLNNPGDVGNFADIPRLNTDGGRNGLIESILRANLSVDLVRESLGIEWADRAKRGRPATIATVVCPRETTKQTTKKKSSRKPGPSRK